MNSLLRCVLVVAVLLAPVLPLAVANHPPGVHPGFTVPLNISTSSGPAGVRVYHVENAAGLAVTGEEHLKYDLLADSVPFHFAVVFANGTEYALERAQWDLATSPGNYMPVQGEANTYVGTPDRHVEPFPRFYFNSTDLVGPFDAAFDVTEAWLVFMWANQEPGQYRAYMNWTTGTTIAPVFASEGADSADQSDMRGGYRAGFTQVPVAHVRDSWNFGSERVFTVLAWERTTFLSYGEIRLSWPGGERVVDLTQTPNDKPSPVFNTCICYREGALVITTPGPVRVDLTYIGDGRRFDMLVLAGEMPTSALPVDIEQWYVLRPGPYD